MIKKYRVSSPRNLSLWRNFQLILEIFSRLKFNYTHQFMPHYDNRNLVDVNSRTCLFAYSLSVSVSLMIQGRVNHHIYMMY